MLCFAGNANNAEPEEDPLATNETFAGAGLNPDGTPETSAENEGVDETIDATRSAVDGAMNSPEEAESTEKESTDFEGLANEIQEKKSKLRDLIHQQSGIRELIRARTSGTEKKTHLADFEKTMLVVEMGINNLNNYEEMTTAVIQFQLGAITPEQFEKRYVKATGKSDDSISGFDAKSITADLSAINDKPISDLERKMERDDIIEKVLNGEDFKNIESFVKEQLKTIDNSVKAVETYTNGLEGSKEHDQQPGMSWSSFWANSMSINDMINGTKKFIEAYKKSYAEWTQLKEARFAQGLGASFSWIPLGKQTATVLNRQTESANDSVRDEHKQGLEAKKPSFEQVLEMIHKTKNANPNHFRALLEYAADHSWLYDLDAINGTAFGIKITNFLPDTWEEANQKEYLREIDNKNGSGQDKEKTRGYDRVSTAENIPPLIRVLHDELSRGNYWAAYGILKRGMEKGKQGETSTWITATIFRYLRDDQNARKYFPKDLLDDLGNIGISSPVWTSTWLKIDRDKIAEWQKKGGEISTSGQLGTIIGLIEEDLRSKLGSNMPKNTQELDRLVARILASQTVLYKGQKFSIFDDRYKEYRKTMGNIQTSISPKDTDDDFFSIDNRGSEMVLLGTEAFRGILGLQSTGEFNEPVKAQYFLGQLTGRVDNLSKTFGENSSELRNFVNATKKRMDNWLLTNANDDRSAVKLGNTSFQNGTPLMLGLFRAGLITMPTILKLNTKDKSGSLSAMIVRQVLKDPTKPMSAQEIMHIANDLKATGNMTTTAHKVISEVVKDTSGYAV